MKIGMLPLGRSTFDIDYANEKLKAMQHRLDQVDQAWVGSRTLLLDDAEVQQAVAALGTESIDHLLVLQVTFTDASAIVQAADTLDVPLSVWAVPEPRAGGRLRLNAFCGLNLASHALGLNQRDFTWFYGDAEDLSDAQLDTLLDTSKATSGNVKSRYQKPDHDGIDNQAQQIVQRISGRKIGRIGEHPAGFHTCAYSAERLSELAGVTVDEIPLDGLFQRGKQADSTAVAAIRRRVADQVSNLDEVDQAQLDRSLRLQQALSELQESGDYSAFAIRCWPETFTEYGGAVCGAVAMQTEARVPCACEADVYGALTQLVLQECADAPVFLTDLVDIDVNDNTGVVWHCGQAPLSMCNVRDQAVATVHTNRKMPLLYQFTLKPGPVTLMRISQARGEQAMVMARADMLDRPMSFTGTSGVLRFERSAELVLTDIIATGLEHHTALAYGDHRDTLRRVAGALQLSVIEL